MICYAVRFGIFAMPFSFRPRNARATLCDQNSISIVGRRRRRFLPHEHSTRSSFSPPAQCQFTLLRPSHQSVHCMTLSLSLCLRSIRSVSKPVDRAPLEYYKCRCTFGWSLIRCLRIGGDRRVLFACLASVQLPYSVWCRVE